MKIAEMRSSIDAENKRKGHPELPSTAPSWVIRAIYERRNGLPLTELPADALNRSDEGRKARLQRALDEIAADKPTDTMKRLRSRYANLFDSN